MYRSRKDLLRRLDWLFSSNGGAETTDIELVLDSTTSSSLSSSTIATDSFNTNNNHDNPATQIIIPTHKCILAAGSEALRTLISLQTYENDANNNTNTNNNKKPSVLTLSSNTNNTTINKPRVYLKGVSPLTAGALLRFLYTGSTHLDNTNTIDVLLASERLGLSILQKLCERHLPTIINEDNICNILIIANNNRLTGLSSIAMSYALRHFDGIIDNINNNNTTNNNGFLQLPRSILASLLAHSDLCIVSEEKLLQGVLRWGIANLPTGIMKDIPINKKLTTPSASASYLSNNNYESSTSSYLKQSNSIASAAGYLNNNSTLPSHLSTINNNNSLITTPNIPTDIFDSTGNNLPAIPITAIPGLKVLLHELFTSLRWASMDIMTLKSPIVSNIVSSELILQAMFEKMGGNNTRKSHTDITNNNDNNLTNNNIVNNYDSFGTSGLLGRTLNNNSNTLLGYSSLTNNNTNNILNRTTLLPSLDNTSSRFNSLHTYNTNSTLSNYDNAINNYDNSRTSRDSAVSAYVSGNYDSISNYTVQTPVRQTTNTSNLFSPTSTGRNNLSDLFSNSSAYPVSASNSNNFAASSSAPIITNFTSPRRYSDMGGNTLSATSPLSSNITTSIPKYLRFDAYISGTVSLSNANRSINFNDISEIMNGNRHLAGITSNKQKQQQQLIEDSLAADGGRGGIVASILPGIAIHKNPGESNNNTGLVSSGLHSYDIVIEDSNALLFTDPEIYSTTTTNTTKSSASTTPSKTNNNTNVFQNNGIVPLSNPISPVEPKTNSTETHIKPFEVAICLLPIGSATTALTNGVRSGDPMAYGAVWFATNRGDVYGLSIPTIEPPVIPAPEAVLDPNAAVPTPIVTVPPTTPKLERIASGLPFGVSSYITVSVDGTTGDIGMSIATSRCGFDKDDEDIEDDNNMDEDDNNWEERERKLANNIVINPLTGESSGAPRPPPAPFVLLPRSSNNSNLQDNATTTPTSSVSIPSNTLHCPDPSGGIQARIHACTCKVNISNAFTQGLQLAVLARVSKGLIVTLVPTLKI